VTRTAATAGAIARRWIATRSGSSSTAPAPGQLAADHDELRIEHVDDRGDGVADRGAGVRHRAAGSAVARVHELEQARDRDRFAAAVFEQAGDRDRARHRLQAAAVSAPADAAVLDRGDMAELAGDAGLPAVGCPPRISPRPMPDDSRT
jgi:hypothetical protein